MPECTLVVRERGLPIAKISLEESSGRVEFTCLYLNSGRVQKGVVKLMGKDSHLIWNSQEIGYLINFSYYNYTPKIRYTFKYTFKTKAEKMGKGHYKVETYMCSVEPAESLDEVLERL